jgi:SAM-dependent methyltransferase
VERYGEPALDLGCGTGRLLIPLLQAGLDVDGTDVSLDMLQRASFAGQAAGFDMDGRLAQQTFAGLDLTRRYRTILCCDSFGIGGSRSADEQAMRRIHDHLAPGGAFVFSIDLLVPGTFDAMTIPEPWPDAKPRVRLADGDELELLRRTASWDPDSHVERMEIRARLWHDDALLAEEEGALAFVHYTSDELRSMLAAAGFDGIRFERAYSGRPSEPGDETVVVVARRPER